jgi:hypothetical protein
VTLGHPLVDAAVADLRLTQVELNAFRVLWGQLDFEVFREKKSDVLALEVGVNRSNASRALGRLVQYGYLEEGPRTARGVGTYRLSRGVVAGVRAAHTSADRPRGARKVRWSL